MSMELRNRLGVWASVLGAVLATISSVSMLAATVSGPLGVMAIAAQSGTFANTVDQLMLPVFQPLLIVSLVLIVIGLAARGLIPLVLAVIGSVLVYLAMFVLPSGAAAMLQMGMSTTEPEPTGLAVFWIGVVGIGAAFFLAYRRSAKRQGG